MSDVAFSMESFIDLMIRIFIPILLVVIVVGIILWIYSNNARKRGIENYSNKANFYSALISIVITIILLAITVSFDINFINIMREKNLIEANKIVYYIVLCSPLIPFSFLIYLIYRFIKVTIHHKEEENIQNNDMANDIQIENSVIDTNNIDINTELSDMDNHVNIPIPEVHSDTDDTEKKEIIEYL